jgi:hypothetical protein
VSGVDVTNHQGDIDWPILARTDIPFAYIEATGCLILWHGAAIAGQIDSEMTLHPQLGSDGCDLALTVRLHVAARQERVCVARHSFLHHVIKLAKLVDTKSESRGILA